MNTNEIQIFDDYSPFNKEIPLVITDIGVVYDLQRVSLPLGLVQVSQVSVPKIVKINAERISLIARDLIGLFAWPDRVDLPKQQKIWRELSLETVRLGCNMQLQEKLTDGEAGLEGSQMKLLVEMIKKGSQFLTVYCKTPEVLSKRKPEEIHMPIRLVIEKLLKRLFPNENELQLHLNGLCHPLLDGCISDLVTPEVITKILLNLEFDYGGEDDGSENGKVKAEMRSIWQKNEKECIELGNALLDCVDVLISEAKERLKKNTTGILGFFESGKHQITKIIVNVSTKILRKFNKYIGGYLFAMINIAMRSEGSKVLNIIELWIKRAGTKQDENKDTDLRQKLELAIRNDFPRVIKYVIDEKDGESEFSKDQAGKIIEEIAPILVEMIWDQKTHAIANFLFYYAPQALVLDEKPQENLKDSSIYLNSKETQKLEFLVIQFVQDYLLPKDEGNNLDANPVNWNAMLMCSIKVGIRKAFSGRQNVTPSPETVHESTMRLGYVFAAMNRFFRDSITRKHTFDLDDKQIEKSLVDLLCYFVQVKYPGKTEIQKEIINLSKNLINNFIDTVFNPVVISNLILKIKLKSLVIPQVPAEGEERLSYEAVGLEAVRLLRTILSLGHEDDSLGWLDAIVASGARKHRMTIGSKIAQAIHEAAQSNDTALMDMLEIVLWRKKENKTNEPIFFEGWIEDKDELQKALKLWLENELLPFISESVSSQGFLMSWFIEAELKSKVKIVTEKLFKLIWHEENKAIRVLILQYLLPIIKSYLPMRV